MAHLMRGALAAAMALGLGVSIVHADDPTQVTIIVRPGDVPDEQNPRPNVGDAPTPELGSDSWQGPASGKSNYHVRYVADGDALTVLFGDKAANLKLSDIESISYWTKQPLDTPAGRDWWIQIYTRMDGDDDQGSWYGLKFTNNYNEHTPTGDWVLHSTDNGMTFRLGNTVYSWDELLSAFGDELIEAISIQTDSGWDGFDGFVDGLTITLTDGSVGIVNFEGDYPASSVVPLPAAAWAGMALLGGLGGKRVWRRRRRA